MPHGYKVYEQKNAIQDDETLGTYFLDEAKYAELEEFAVAPGEAELSHPLALVWADLAVGQFT